MRDLRLAVIGTGRMARLLARILKDSFSETVLISRDVEKARKLSKRLGVSYGSQADASRFDYYLFTSPPRYLPETVKAFTNRLKPGSLVSDICSVKSGVVREVEKLIPPGVEYISLHPLFGPSTRRIKGNNLVMIPIRGKSFITSLQELFESLGLRVVVASSPEEHDEMMAAVQVAHHISQLSLILTLWKLIGSDKLRAYSTRSLRKTLKVIKSFRGNLKVIREISELNPHGKRAVEALEDLMRRLLEGDEASWRLVEEALKSISK